MIFPAGRNRLIHRLQDGSGADIPRQRNPGKSDVDARLRLAKIIRRFAFVRRHTSLRGIELGKGYERHGKHHKIDGAAFGADGPASEPARTVKTRIQEVPSSQQAAIRTGKDEGFAIISRGMKADCKPEISGTSQCKAGKKAEKCHGKRSDPSFSGVT